MKGKKVIHWGGPGGNGGTVIILSWKCNFIIYMDIKVYYLDIQSITTLLCLLLVLYVLVPSIHSFFCYNRSPEKWRFPVLKSLLLPQFSTYRHRTGFIVKRKRAYYQLSRFTYKLEKKNLHIFKVGYFAKRKYLLFQKFPKIYHLIFFFQKEVIGHTYICTKCNGDFKFTISLKS